MGAGVHRPDASVLHIDLDAFYAAVEQRDKTSLRGRPVIVGGTGGRGVVSTASYEARVFGVRSAMPMAEARARCPQAAVLAPRFDTYRTISEIVMEALRELSPLVEPLSLDEAFVDLSAGPHDDLSPAGVTGLATDLREAVRQRTDLTASVGAATTKTLAKIASEKAKPDGLLVVAPGSELDVLHPLPVRALWGIGPATGTRLRRLGVRTVGDLAMLPEAEVRATLGESHGHSLAQLARGVDPRPVVAERDSKSISVEDTFEQDIVDASQLRALVQGLARKVGGRLSEAGLSGRTITLKARLHDFSTLSRSATLPGPTNNPRVISEVAVRLLRDIDATGGLRLLGVGVSGLAGWVQDDLFGSHELTDDSTHNPAHDPAHDPTHKGAESSTPDPPEPEPASWRPGQDVVHDQHGPGWVWGSGLGRVTVRFEHRYSSTGPVHTFRSDDVRLRPGGGAEH